MSSNHRVQRIVFRPLILVMICLFLMIGDRAQMSSMVYAQTSTAQDAPAQNSDVAYVQNRCEVIPLPDHQVSMQIDGVEKIPGTLALSIHARSFILLRDLRVPR